MSPENKEHYQSEKDAIHLLLTRIGDKIYSTVDACKTTHDMWIAIERLQQGESLNIQDVKTNLFWEFGKFTSHDGETMESYYSRFYKMMNEMIRNNLTVATMQVNLFDVLKQYQKEVNEIHAERITKNANPLALVAGKEIAKPITPPSESVSEEDNLQTYQQQPQNFFKLQKQKCGYSPRYKNDNQTGQFRNQRTVTVAGARKTLGSRVIDEQELEAHYNYMAKIQEVPIADSGTDTKPLEQVDSNVIPNSPDMCDNDIQTDQNAVECDAERVALANLIANLTLDTEENKKILKQLKKANASLT
ncbi:hypothetical protein Tco_1465450 [Tanacetum coccineum]